MKRTVLIPIVSALIGGGVVVAAVAATGNLGSSSQKTVTVVQQSAPIAPSNASQQSKGLTPHQIYERTAPGVAYITSTIVRQSESPFGFGESQTQQGTATGSGFVINKDGTILTNYHVVENAVKVTVSFEHGKAVEAKVIGKDPSNDLAVLRIPTEGVTLHPVTLGDSAKAQVGDPVLAIGNPFGLERTLTTGVVSALQRQITSPNGFTIDNVIQTDAPINPGNSGGPLLNGAGEVIGINSQIETGGNGGGSVGIGFAVPIDTAERELSQLEKGGTATHAYLGVSTLTVDGSLSALNLPVKSGALVETVEAGTPAAKAGIRGGNLEAQSAGGKVAVGGDIIVKAAGKAIGSAEDLSNLMGSKKPGETISVEVLRATGNGSYEHKTLSVTLTARPNSVKSANTPEG